MKKRILFIILIIVALAWFIPVKVENIASYDKKDVPRKAYRAFKMQLFLQGGE
jgi:hypothetical protein